MPRKTIEATNLPPEMIRFLVINVLLVIACLGAEMFCASVLHAPAAYRTPFLLEHSPDYFNFAARFPYLHQKMFFDMKGPADFMYPAPVALPYIFFYSFSPNSALPFACFIFLSFGIAALIFRRNLLRRGLSVVSSTSFVVLALLSSFPLWFVAKQANMEIVVWVILTTAFWFFFHERPAIAAILIGFAGAMKLFPFVFLGLFLARKQYRYIVIAGISAAVITVTSLWIVNPDILYAWRHISRNLDEFRRAFMLRLRIESGYDHSLFVGFKLLRRLVTHSDTPNGMLSAYLGSAALVGTTLYFTIIRKLPVANQILCLTIASIWLPPVSFEYTLIHIYTPLALLCFVSIQAARRGIKVPGLMPAFICLGVLASPLAEFLVRGTSFDGPIKVLFLSALFVIGLRYPFAEETANVPVAS